MVTKQRSLTQIFRQAQQGQLLEHVALIQELEEKVARLERELTTLRTTSGSQELQQLPLDTLRTLLTVFDVVPIPDLSGWERRQSVAKLSAALLELQQRDQIAGGIPAGTWSPDDGSGEPSLQIGEGDGAAVARVTRELVKILGEAAGKYLSQMVEFQGITPDHVSRARAGHLMDVSSQVDAKAQYGLLPAESQRALFENHMDELIHAKDQLYTVTHWMNEGRELARSLLGRLGLSAGRNASLLGVLRVLAESDEVHESASPRAALRALVTRYSSLLPEQTTLETLGLGDSQFQQVYARALSDESELQLLAGAQAEVLADHDVVSTGLRSTTIATREKKALTRLAKAHAASPAVARRALLQVVGRLSAVEESQARLETAQKAVAKRFSRELELHVRQVIESSPRPEAQAAAYERLSKSERTAYLAKLWLELIDRLNHLVSDESQGLVGLLQRSRETLTMAVGSPDTAALDSRRRAFDVLAEALRNPPDVEADALSLATPIDVEEGLLKGQAVDLRGRVEAFMGKYTRSKRAGTESLEGLVSKLNQAEALTRGKKAALDVLLKKSLKGKLSPKREAAEANELLAEQRAVEEGREALKTRKASALAHVAHELDSLGLGGISSYAELFPRVTRERRKIAEAVAARNALTHCEEQVVQVLETLHPGGVAKVSDAQSFLRSVEVEARALSSLAEEVARAQAVYLEAANRTLRKAAPGFAEARSALTEVEHELDLTLSLRMAAASYQAGFSVFRHDLNTLDKIRSWVRREGKKATELRGELSACAESINKAVSKLGRGDQPFTKV